MNPVFEVIACVLCEEIRQEASGQSILVGAQNRGPSVNVEDITTLSRIAFYIEAKVRGVERAKFRFVNSQSNEVAFEDGFDLPIADELKSRNVDDWTKVEAMLQLSINMVDIDIPRSGNYKLQVSFDSMEWADVREYLFPALHAED